VQIYVIHKDTRLLVIDAHHLCTAPGDRAHVAVGDAVGLQDFLRSRIDFRHAPGDFESQHLSRAMQPLVVLGHLENAPFVGALALENGAGVVKTVTEHVQLRVAPWNQRPVNPDRTVTIIERKHGNRGSSGPIKLRLLTRFMRGHFSPRGRYTGGARGSREGGSPLQRGSGEYYFLSRLDCA